MARQSIPRSDLYGDLGVDPSADADAVESAYRELIDPLSGSNATSDVRRAARLRVAREWLTDPELRSRYDASRARAAARAEKAAAEEAQAFAESAADPATPELTPPAPIPWPVRDLQRESPDIEWSATPADATDDRASARRRSRLPLGVIGLLGLAAIVMVATYALATNMFFSNVAVNPTATANGVVASPSAEPSTVATVVPSTAPSIAPSAPPASVAPSVPADVAAMQQAAWQTLESLRTAAASGDVRAAQAYLGDTAQGLRRSGLRRATFPQLDPTSITVDASDTLYLAVAGTDHLTSPDGVVWTFDYGDRPLAAYRSPNGEPVHDLWWEETDGQHHLFVQVSVATLSRNGVTADVRWSFDAARPSDATYFRRSTAAITSVSMDGAPVAITSSPLPMDGLTSLTLTTTLAGVEALPSRLDVGITFTNPRTATSDDRHIETVFALDVR